MTPPAQSILRYRPELDGLRAVAVLGVFAFHLLPKSIPGGYLGVDVFFVLSGFLITALIMKSTADKSFSFFDFYIRRARRLLPALIVAVIFTLLVAGIIFSPEHYKAAGQSGIYASLGVANIHFWLSTGYFDLATSVKPFIHYWSLGVEEQFYLIWPALLVFGAAIFGRAGKLGLLVILSLISFGAMVWVQINHYDAAFYLMPFRIWEFGAGACLVFIGSKRSDDGAAAKSLLGAVLTLAGLALILASFWWGVKIDNLAALLLVPVAGAGMIIAGGLNIVSRAVLANPVSRFLGKISYSLYLYHWPVIIFARYIFGADLSPVILIGVIVIATGLAYLSYRFIETPFRKGWTASAALDRMAVPAALAPIILGIVFTSSHIWNQSGWAWRLSPELRKVVEATREVPNPNCEHRLIPGVDKRLCVFGDRREKIDFVIIGDSHSNALAAGLTHAMKQQRLTGVAMPRGGRVPLMNTQIITTSGRGFRGDSNADFAAAFAVKPDYILLHARFALYWHTTGGDNAMETATRYLTQLDGRGDLSAAATQAQFELGLRETLQNIKARGIRPIIIGPVPNPGVDPLQCLSRPYLRTVDSALASCHGFSQTQSRARNADVMARLKALSEQEGAIFFDPTPIYCRPGAPTCNRVVNGRLIYRDDDHLSLYGGRLLGGRIVNMIQKEREKSIPN